MSILHFKNLGLFLSFFSSSKSFCFKSPPHLKCIKIFQKIRRNFYFLQCNGMWGVFKPENIVVTNETALHCKLKQASKIIFQFKCFN